MLPPIKTRAGATRRIPSPLVGALILLVMLAGDRSATAMGDEDLLSAGRLYHGVGRPIPLVLALRGRSEAPENGFTVLLVASDGEVVDSVEGLMPGEFDLGRELPVALDLVKAARLQVVADGEPVGAPLVVEPLLGREPVRTVSDLRPSGRTRYPRIIGFGDALLPGASEEDRAELERQRTSPDWDPGEPRVLSGYRIYPDRDVVIETDFGEVRIDLAPESAPNTAWNFRHLAENGFYDDTLVHRIVHFDRTGRRFVIQSGDPTGTGNGSAGWDLPMERSTLQHDLGVISMARADHPDSAGSQFFFCLGRPGTARLDGQYCAFGYAVEGDRTIAGIADVEIEDVAAGRPAEPPVITRMTLVPAPPQTPGDDRGDRRIRSWWTPEVVEEPETRRPR